MNAIFLDIDGVLNCHTSKSKCGQYTGIDKDKVKRLARIVNETNSKIVLTSTWKHGWQPNHAYSIERTSLYEFPENYHAKYLDNHLMKKGKLTIYDKTHDNHNNIYYRGSGIYNWLESHPKVKNWVVLDDDRFPDFETFGIYPHLVLTNPLLGLTDDDADAAIEILEGSLIGPYTQDPFFKDKFVKYKMAGPNVIVS